MRTSNRIDLACATFRTIVRSIALVGFVTLTTVAMVLGNTVPTPDEGAVTKPPSRSPTVINLFGLPVAALLDVINPRRMLDPNAAVCIMMALCSVDSLISSPLPGSLSRMT